MLTHVGLFEGSGIPSLAAAACGIKTVAYSEVDPACCYALARLWPEAIALGDVKTADWSLVPQPVGILTAGVPCQPVSTAGKQKGAKDERWLWPETIRAVRELRPAWLLFENPRAIVLHGLERIVEELEGIGYDFIPKGRDGRFAPLCIGADDVGAPHKRKRVWIVAHKLGQRCERWQGNASGCDGNRTIAGRQQSDNQLTGSRSQGRLVLTNQQPSGCWSEEPQRGLEGREAAGRAGDGSGAGELGHPESRRAPAAEQRRRLREPVCAGDRLADATGQREREPDYEDGTESRGRDARGDAGRDGSRAGELGNATGDDQRRTGSRQGRQSWTAGGSGGSGGELADSNRTRLPLNVCQPRDTGSQFAAIVGSRWPARPGQPQHEWERPRLAGLSGVPAVIRRLLRTGNPSLVECSRKAEALQEQVVADANTELRLTLAPLGDILDGLAGRVHGWPDNVPLGILSKVNKQMLRAAGNAWVYPCAMLLFQWIASQKCDTMRTAQASLPPEPF